MSHPDKLKVLLVDDRPENLVSLEKLLDRPDLEILKAESGNTALNLMLDHDLSLVLLDVQMPEMDGFEVAELMRRSMRTRNVPIIFVTAINKERRHQFNGYEAGAVDYIFKPVDPFIIRSKVNVFLEIKRQQLARERLLVELNQANNRLQEVSARKSEFLAAASHELRTPLTVIKEYTSLMLDEVVGFLNEDQQRCMESISRNGNRLAKLVDDLLDLDSIEAGQSPLARRRLDLSELIDLMAADFQKKMEKSGQQLALDVDRSAPVVLADPDLITQVLYNLIGNANKFVPAGGTVTLRLGSDDDHAVVEVVDDGPGISSADQDRVFEKFTRLERTGGHRAGTGLGLPLSRKIIEMNGGRLTLTSELELGSTFRFSLPAYSEEKHLAAFIDDGRRSGTPGGCRWTLVQFRGIPENEWGRERLHDDIVRVFRCGEDRTERIVQDGEWRQLVLLRTGLEGAASFLARLQDQWSRAADAPTGLQYSLQTLLEDDSAGRGWNFQSLEMDLESERKP